MDKENFDYSLPVHHISRAIHEAVKRVEHRREGKQDYIKTRWDKVNSALLGGINFSSIYVIAGLMGTGKSFVRTLIQQDAFNKQLNGGCIYDYLWLHFNFEMVASSEVMRLAGSEVGLSFYELLSVEKRLEEEAFEMFKSKLHTYKDMDVYMCNVPGDVNRLLGTVQKTANRFPNKKLIISIDHTLLVERLDEGGENEVMAHLAAAAIRIKQVYGAAVILLSQLKTTLQSPQRKDKPENQYPVNDDIFGSKTIPQAADFVIILNRPELLHLQYYGPDRYPTKDLLAFHITKNRDGYPGVIRMKHDFAHGVIRQWEPDDDLLQFSI